MLKRNFINNIKRGLGSAFVELSNAVNKDEYRESLSYCITHNCTYDYIFEGSKGDYLYRFINIYEDKSYFIDIVINTLFNMKSYSSLHAQLLDILMEDYYNGNDNIKKIFEEYYSHFIKNGRWNKNKINCYDYLSIKISCLFGIRKVRDIIADWKKLNINICDYWFGFHVNQKYRKYNLINIELDNEHTDEYKHTFEEFLELINTKDHVYCFGSFATEEEHQKCMDYLVDNNNKIIVKKILINYQSEYVKRKINIEVLLTLIDKFDAETNIEIYNTLAYYKDKRVVDLAFKLAETANYKIAIHMLMSNYKKEYKDLIISLYKKIRFSFNSYESLTFDTIDFMMNKKKNMPDEILYITYYNDYCAFNREYIVRCMNKRNLLTESIKEELKYDSDYETRKYAKRLYKK